MKEQIQKNALTFAENISFFLMFIPTNYMRLKI